METEAGRVSPADQKHLEQAALQRPWLRGYPSHLPADLIPTLPDLLSFFRRAAQERPGHEALRYFDAVLTYGDVDSLSDDFGSWLAQMGVSAGDRIGIVLQNVPHAVIVMLAAWKVGAITVFCNPMYREVELATLFADFAPSAIVVHQQDTSTAAAALDAAGLEATPIIHVSSNDFQTACDARVLPSEAGGAPIGDTTGFLGACESGRGQPPSYRVIDPVSPGLILYTSGTTGQPKGVVISHKSLAFNSENGARWMGLHQASRMLGMAPLFHITGVVLHIGVAIVAGCSVALCYRFHTAVMLDMVRAYRPTCTIAAITAFNALMSTSDATLEDFTGFEACFTGGAPMSPALHDAVRKRLGLNLMPIYGMTETCSPTHVAPPGRQLPFDPLTGALSVGIPISSTYAMIAGPSGEPLPPRAAGEIWMRGPQVMTGYWNKPQETAEAIHDGWLRSGDIGMMDEDGWFYVVDRQKDMINASGFKVWPRQVEDVLVAHPAVREAAVIGVPDTHRGETVHAYISLKAGVDFPGEDAMIAHCRDSLAAYKVPRRLFVLTELPKTQTGKIQRAALRSDGMP